MWKTPKRHNFFYKKYDKYIISSNGFHDLNANSVIYSGLQARSKEVNAVAEHASCAGNSTNLIEFHEIEGTPEAASLLNAVQVLYKFLLDRKENFFDTLVCNKFVSKQFINITVKLLKKECDHKVKSERSSSDSEQHFSRFFDNFCFRGLMMSAKYCCRYQHS